MPGLVHRSGRSAMARAPARPPGRTRLAESLQGLAPARRRNVNAFPSHRRAHAGFTLMEILVAFVVLATAVAVLYRTFSANIRNVDVISGYSEAIAIADAKLLSLALEQQMKEGEESGMTDDKRFRWTVNIQPYTPPGSFAEPPNTFFNANTLLRATVTVTWDETREQARSVSLWTVRMFGRNQL